MWYVSFVYLWEMHFDYVHSFPKNFDIQKRFVRPNLNLHTGRNVKNSFSFFLSAVVNTNDNNDKGNNDSDDDNRNKVNTMITRTIIIAMNIMVATICA